MGISDSKTYSCFCDECNDSYDDLALDKGVFIDQLESSGWKITQYGNKALCPNCKDK